MHSDAVAVVLAAGSGSRVGADGNKAYLTLDGSSMLVWSLDTALRIPEVARTVLVFRQGESELARRTVARELPGAAVEFVEGGPTRHQSERNVLRHLSGDIESGAVDVILTTTPPARSPMPGCSPRRSPWRATSVEHCPHYPSPVWLE